MTAGALAALVWAPAPAHAADARPQTVPALQTWSASGGASWSASARTRIVVRHQDRRFLAGEARQLAHDLGAQLGRRVAWTVRRGTRARRGDVLLARTRPDAQLGAEGYALRIGRAFSVLAPTRAGVFYGGRSLLQLLRTQPGGAVPAGRARDWPRYPERGLMVDAGRKYYSPDWLISRIEEISALKMDLLHLHLSDDQGYRIESRVHPEVVSPRHLTFADVRRIVAAARRYHVAVVPEIDTPGHLQWALRTHPEYQLRDASGQRQADVLDVTDPAAVAFARDLVTEVMDVFGGPSFHLGADEVVPGPLLQLGRFPALTAYALRRYGPTAVAKDAIQGYVNDMAALVRAHGKTARMWSDDVGGGAVRRDARIVVEWWTELSPLSDVIAPAPGDLLGQGFQLLNAGWFPTYFVNGFGGSSVRITPDLRAAYEDWDVGDFCGVLCSAGGPALGARVGAGDPRVRGVVLNLWNDNPAYSTEAQDAPFIRPGLRVLAQKGWGSQAPTPDYATFAALAARAAGTP